MVHLLFEVFLLGNDLYVTNKFYHPDVDVLVIMVTNEAQAENVLFGDFGAVSGTQIPFRFPSLFCD